MALNPKVLGFAMIGVFALLGIAASAAQAEGAHFTADSGTTNTIFTAEADFNAPTQIYSFSYGSASCTMFSGKSTAAKTSEEFTLTNISYSGTVKETNTAHCEGFGLKAVFELNGCDYMFHAGSYNVGTNDSSGAMDIACPAGQSMVINAGGGLCKVTIEPQVGINNITYTNVAGAPANVTIDMSSTNISYTGIGGLCNDGITRNTGAYIGKLTIKAYEDGISGVEGSQVSATITST